MNNHEQPEEIPIVLTDRTLSHRGSDKDLDWLRSDSQALAARSAAALNRQLRMPVNYGPVRLV